jgi:hypothetical protein
MCEVRKAAHVWRRETTTEGKKLHVWCGLYKSVRTIFMYMYTGFSGDSRVCMWVSVETVACMYVSLSGDSMFKGRMDFMGNKRSRLSQQVRIG